MILNSHGLLGPGLGKQSTAQPRIAAGLTPPGSPVWWWDGADTSSMYTTEAKTANPATDEDAVMVWTSKGSNTLDLTTASATAAELNASWTNGVSSVVFDLSAGGLSAESGIQTMGAGWTVVGMWDTTNGVSQNWHFSVETPTNNDIGTTNWFNDTALITDGTTNRHTDDEWTNGTLVGHIGYHGDEGSGAWWSRASGSPTILTGTDVMGGGVEIGDNVNMVVNAISGIVNIGEIIVYNGTLADNSLTDEDIITYLNEKWAITFVAAS